MFKAKYVTLKVKLDSTNDQELIRSPVSMSAEDESMRQSEQFKMEQSESARIQIEQSDDIDKMESISPSKTLSFAQRVTSSQIRLYL